ncbi:MAG: mechanosensitive ion channel family protein [Rhodothermales bacterium]
MEDFLDGLDLSVALAKIQDMAQGAIRLLPNLVLAVLVFLFFLLVAQGVRKLIVKSTESRSRNLSLLLGRLARTAIIIFGVLVAISLVTNVGASELIGILGVSGVAIGFAFKDIFENFLAGILILLTRPFVVGDQIKMGDYEGTVENIETRATTLKTFDSKRAVIPNADLYTNSVVVNTAYDRRRSEYDVGIGYEDDIDKAKELILEATRGTEGVLESPAPQALTVELAGSSVNIRARWWTKPDQASAVLTKDRVITAIKQRLDAGGINIPFPIRTVYFNDETGYFQPQDGAATEETSEG